MRTTRTNAKKALNTFKNVNVKMAEGVWRELRSVAVQRQEPTWLILQTAINRYLSECARSRHGAKRSAIEREF